MTVRLGTDTDTDSNSNHNDNPPSLSFSATLPPLKPDTRRLYLLRHGETDWNVQGRIQGGGHDIPLNENGRRQAKELAKELSHLPIGVVASSPLSRASQTADIVHSALEQEQEQQQVQQIVKVKRTIHPGLFEMCFGDFEGIEWKSDGGHYLRYRQQMLQDANLEFPNGGESTNQVLERAAAAMIDLLQEHPDEQHIAVVSHGRTNKILLGALVYGNSLEYPKVEQGNACINAIDYHDGEWKPQVLNYVKHISGNVTTV